MGALAVITLDTTWGLGTWVFPEAEEEQGGIILIMTLQLLGTYQEGTVDHTHKVL